MGHITFWGRFGGLLGLLGAHDFYGLRGYQKRRALFLFGGGWRSVGRRAAKIKGSTSETCIVTNLILGLYVGLIDEGLKIFSRFFHIYTIHIHMCIYNTALFVRWFRPLRLAILVSLNLGETITSLSSLFVEKSTSVEGETPRSKAFIVSDRRVCWLLQPEAGTVVGEILDGT